MKPRLFLFCLLTVPSLSSCSLFTTPNLLEGFAPADDVREQTVLESLQRSRSGLRTGRGIFNAELEKTLGRQTVRQVFAFERPSRLRLELYASSLEQLAGLSIIRDGLLESLDPKEKRLYRGYADRKNMERLFGLPLIADELVLWMTGNVPEVREPDVVSQGEILGIRGRLDDDTFFSAQLDEAGAETYRVRSLELRQADGSLRFSSELMFGPDGLPSEIRFELPEHGMSGVLTRESLKINPELPAERLFRIRVPAGVTIHQLD